MFGAHVRTVSEHLRSVHASGEFAAEASFRKIRMVRKEGEREAGRDSPFSTISMAEFSSDTESMARRPCKFGLGQFQVEGDLFDAVAVSDSPGPTLRVLLLRRYVNRGFVGRHFLVVAAMPLIEGAESDVSVMRPRTERRSEVIASGFASTEGN